MCRKHHPDMCGWLDVGWMCGWAIEQRRGGWANEINKTKQAAYKTMLGKQQTHGMKMLEMLKKSHKLKGNSNENEMHMSKNNLKLKGH